MKSVAKKTLIGIAGGLVLLAGIAMIVLPGPAFIIIPAGLAILATEFAWADRLKQRCKDRFQRLREAHQRKRQNKQKRAMA